MASKIDSIGNDIMGVAVRCQEMRALFESRSRLFTVALLEAHLLAQGSIDQAAVLRNHYGDELPCLETQEDIKAYLQFQQRLEKLCEDLERVLRSHQQLRKLHL